jgi:hypothetical protein
MDCRRSIGFTARVRQESCHARPKPQEERARRARTGADQAGPPEGSNPGSGDETRNRGRNPRGQRKRRRKVEAAAAGEAKVRCAPGRVESVAKQPLFLRYLLSTLDVGSFLERRASTIVYSPAPSRGRVGIGRLGERVKGSHRRV